MNEKIDDGPIYYQESFSLKGNLDDIFDRIVYVGTDLTLKLLDDFERKNNPETISSRIIFPEQIFYKGIYEGTIRYKRNNKIYIGPRGFLGYLGNIQSKNRRAKRAGIFYGV